MNKFLASTALSLLPFAALASDLPARSYAPAPVSMAYNWTGFQAGVFLGGAYNRSNNTVTYGGLQGQGVGFGADGSVSSTAFNNYHAGTGPAATSIDLLEDWFNGGANGFAFAPITASTTQQRTDAFGPLSGATNSIVGAFGGEIGYMYQMGGLVIGAAIDGTMFTGASDSKWSSNGAYSRNEFIGGGVSATVPNAAGAAAEGSISRDSFGSSQSAGSMRVGPKWLSTARLSAGIAEDRFLAFASGGAAMGSVKALVASRYNDSNSSICAGQGDFEQTSNGAQFANLYVRVECGGPATVNSSAVSASASARQTTNATWSGSQDKMRFGYTLGGGFGYAFGEHVILKTEAYYYNLGSVSTVVQGTATTSVNGGAATATGAASYTVRSKVDGVIGRMGVAYKF